VAAGSRHLPGPEEAAHGAAFLLALVRAGISPGTPGRRRGCPGRQWCRGGPGRGPLRAVQGPLEQRNRLAGPARGPVGVGEVVPGGQSRLTTLVTSSRLSNCDRRFAPPGHKPGRRTTRCLKPCKNSGSVSSRQSSHSGGWPPHSSITPARTARRIPTSTTSSLPPKRAELRSGQPRLLIKTSAATW
jgi:hypothetical protein